MPDLSPQQTFQLALQHVQANHPTDALPLLQKLYLLNPSHPEVVRFMGICFFMQGRQEQALKYLQDAVALAPASPLAYDTLATALHQLGQFDEAIASLRKAIALDPHSKDALLHLGVSLRMTGQLNEAKTILKRLLQSHPNHPHGWTSLGNVYRDQGRLDEAINTYQKSIDVFPNFAEAHESLAVTLSQLARYEEAAVSFRKAISLAPNSAAIHSNFLYTFCFDPAQTPATTHEEHLRWNAAHETPLQKFHRPHPNPRDPDSRLRIGYVSPDFFAQAESFFVIPLLESHDREQFEMHCYSSVARPDAITERCKKAADQWHDVRPLSNLVLAEKIRADGIDILVDLTMHMANNRLPLFAMKPAPIQVAWLAYPGSTGLTTMDYRITDAIIDPLDEDQSRYSEKPLRLPDSWCCYWPLTDLKPHQPRQAGLITFGSLNNPCKYNAPLLAVWSDVLRAVPDSRLLLLAYNGSQRERLLQLFQKNHIDPARIEFISKLSREEYLRTYDRIDIALDTLPYNGVTTTCDALWMGTPVLTLTGPAPASRTGASLLTAAGLPELITQGPEEFVRCAVELANNHTRLDQLHATLRPQLTNSPLMDGPRFARNLESAYRQCWHSYCTS